MTKQQKIVIQQLGESFRDCTSIVDDEQVEPGPGELRVRNHFAGVNGVYDQMMCLNRVEHTQVDPPCATGVEAVGVIEALGEGVEGFAIDDPVAVVQVGGAYRHVQICKTENASLIPAISPGALAIVPSAVSALIALEQVAEMKAGQLMCITAAAAGLGNALDQLALMTDHRVIAV